MEENNLIQNNYYELAVNLLFVFIFLKKAGLIKREYQQKKEGYLYLTPKFTQIIKNVPFVVSFILYINYIILLFIGSTRLDVNFAFQVAILMLVSSTIYVKESNVFLGKSSIIIDNKEIVDENIQKIIEVHSKSLWKKYSIITNNNKFVVLLNEFGVNHLINKYERLVVKKNDTP